MGKLKQSGIKNRVVQREFLTTGLIITFVKNYVRWKT